MNGHCEVLVVGAGISGVAAAIRLKREGIEDFVVLDKGSELGGTWRDNRYPGVACDVPSALFSFSFAPNPGWSRLFAPGPEIHEYLLRIVSEFDIRRHVRLRTEMLEARWDEHDARWRVKTSKGMYVARVVIFATGLLEDRNIPSIPGIDRFEGRIFHSSRWPEGYDGAGERVAVVGTGASAIQIVPELQRTAREVVLFQRTPAWVYPKPDWRHSRLERAAMRRFPIVQRALRGAIWAGIDATILTIFCPRIAHLLEIPARLHLRLRVRDRQLRKALTPSYLPGCKRALVSNAFYPALQQRNVRFIDSPVTSIGSRSILAADGGEHDIDTIVLSTGFNYTTAPIFSRIKTRDGRTLAEKWQGTPRAYKGTAIAGCPNAFMLWGPNAGTGSAFVMAEAQMSYISGAIEALRCHRLDAVEVREERERAWKAQADRRNATSVMNRGGCVSYYLDANGHNAALWPGTMRSLRASLARFDLDAYDIRGPSAEGDDAAPSIPAPRTVELGTARGAPRSARRAVSVPADKREGTANQVTQSP
jgi:cation diffusion facilitator CzcD-associated flavoprotein CzcO